VRRARLGFEGENERLRYGLVVGTSSPYDAVAASASSSPSGAIHLVDAYGGYAPIQDLWVMVGQQRPPISRDALFSAGQHVFQEGAVSTEWMVPGRDAGLIVDYKVGPGRARLGAFNGNGSAFGDDGSGKLLSGRLEAAVGPGGTYRTHGRVDGFTLGAGVDGFLDDDVATSTIGAGADLIARIAGLSVLVEGRYAAIAPGDTTVDDPDVAAETRQLGALAHVGYSAGHLEPALRVSMYDDDMDADDNGDVARAEVGLTWHGLQDSVRAGAGYVLRLEQGGETYANDTVRLWMQLEL
jgi:hypothetical protein